jgi:hypothetical protein
MKRIKTFLFLAARRYEYLDEDSPDPEESDQPDRGLSLSPGPPAAPTSPPGAADPGPASPPERPSRSGWDMSQMLWLAGGSGLQSVIARSDATMPTEDLPIACKRAAGESRRSGLKRKAAEIT